MPFMKCGRNLKEYLRRNQAGSTLITVLVGVSFMLILASIILTVSFANLQMKQIDYRAKSNFYEDEKGLDDVYNGLGRDISECLSKAYNDTLSQVTAADGEPKYTSQSKAYENFVMLFQIRLEALYGSHGEHKDATRDLLRGYVTNDNPAAVEAEVIDYGSTLCELTSEGYLSRYVFQDVQVKYTERNAAEATGYESVITTDIVVEVPYISFFQDFSRVLDYSLIGNDGIYFQDCTRSIEGNVFAGTDGKSANADYQGYRYSSGAVYDGMNFYRSSVSFMDNNYIISKGDFNICESSVLIQAPAGKKASTAFWTENIRTVENERASAQITVNSEPASSSVLRIDANIFAANDLELNARKSEVELKGNYYGYNYNNTIEGAYETTQGDSVDSLYHAGKSNHARSSSIILNANQSSLDVTGLDTLVIAGLAYVDVRDPQKAYQETEYDGKSVEEYITGESLALKYNQMLYLAPMDILYVENPKEDGDSLNINEVCPPKADEKSKVAFWFGNSYLNESEPVKAITYDYSGSRYTYYYLNFKSDAEKSAYVEEVMAAVDPGEAAADFDKQRWELKQSILNKAADTDIESKIQIDGSGCRIYTKGVVTSTTDGSVLDNTITKPAVYNDSLNMARHFEYLWKRLDPVEGEDIVSDHLSIAELNSDISARGLAEEDLPAAYFVDLDKIVTDETGTVGGYDVIIKTETGSIIPQINTPVKGIVLSKGDIIVNSDVEGIVISGGKITVTGSGSIKADRGIVQMILEKEQKELSGIKTEKLTRDLLEGYASYYFKQMLLDDTLVNESNHKYRNSEQRVTSTEYTDFIYFQNWRKGA